MTRVADDKKAQSNRRTVALNFFCRPAAAQKNFWLTKKIKFGNLRVVAAENFLSRDVCLKKHGLIGEIGMIITDKGYKKILLEIEKLKDELKAVREDKASAYILTGDTWHDNPYFKMVEQKERQILNRIDELYISLNRADHVEVVQRNVEEVALGSIIKCRFMYEEEAEFEEEIFEIVGHGESNADERQISYESPVAKNLLGHKLNDTVTFETPAGKASYTITKFYNDWDEVES